MKANRKAKPKAVRVAQARGAGLASTTRGRARTFVNRKKEQARRVCRKPLAYSPG
jgi:hypothetical protein